MKRSLVQQCLRIAREHLPHHSERKFLHYSFIIQAGRIVEWATNKRGTPPIHYGYHKHNKTPKIHSEVMAYKRARGLLVDGWEWICLNIRLNKKGEVRKADPCMCCRELLTCLGCFKFYVVRGG